MPPDGGSKTRPTILTRHPVVVFFVLAFLISWGGVLAILLPTGTPGSGEDLERLYGPAALPMLAGPFLSAFVVSAMLGGWAGLGAPARGLAVWRAKPIEYAAAFLLIPSCALAVLLSLSAVSSDYTPSFLSSNGGLPTVVLFLSLGLFVGLIEETGWTGFAISRLIEGRTVLALGISFGFIHALWHFLVVYSVSIAAIRPCSRPIAPLCPLGGGYCPSRAGDKFRWP